MSTGGDVPGLFDLTGRVALVTGAAGGLGAQTAAALAGAGATVVGADLDGDAAAAAGRAAPAGPGALVGAALDVTDADAVTAVVRDTVDRFGGLDVLVNNAGVADPHPGPLHEASLADWRRVVEVNLHGVVHCARAALRVMVPAGRGRIVNVASMWGLLGPSATLPLPAYAASKGAVVNLTRELGLQYATAGIGVNALCPGFFRTGMGGGAYDDGGFRDRLAAATPMGRVADPAEIRGAVLFLASARASGFMTGQTLVVDGGYSAG